MSTSTHAAAVEVNASKNLDLSSSGRNVVHGSEAERAPATLLEQAYDAALQLIELRERHGLIQAELADRGDIDVTDR